MSLFSRFKRGPHSRVLMLASVDDQHVAGEQYDLPVELADRYVIRGYAEGALSRDYTPAEISELGGNPQVVSF